MVQNLMTFYFVRKIKGHYYLYKVEYDPYQGKKQKLIGNCTAIEQAIKQNKTNKTKRVRRLAWLGRRPDAATLKQSGQSKSYNPTIPAPSSELVVKFINWCLERNNEKTCRDRSNYLKKPLDPDNNHSVKAYRLFYKFLGIEPPRELKIKRSGIDLNVPSLTEVKHSIEKACGIHSWLCLIYHLLLESGARLTEVMLMLNNYDVNKDKQHNGFYVYELSAFRKSKKSFYIYHVTRVEPGVSWREDWVSKQARIHNLVRPKHMRKFVSTRMASLGVPESIIDFIQGRTPRSILSRHYLNLYALATKEYVKYAQWLGGEGFV